MKEILTEANIKWFIGVIIPVIVTVSGWIYVYRLGQKNIRRDKQITTYINTFNFIKDPINDAIQKYSNLSTFLNLTYTRIQRLTKDNMLLESEMNFLLESYNNKEFEILKNEASDAFLKFSYSWEQYEIVLLPLVEQRHALQDEFHELIHISGNAHTEYFTYFYCINQGIEVAETSKERLLATLQNFHDKSFDFFACIRDVNISLQNFIFKDLLGQTVEKRKVMDNKYLTIDELMTKHNKS
ncbi:hypothetical protein [Paenibacillus harenae]|uniref:Phage abortive infection protein n=1 Tax=Paenibacillus harenae TaxID=306543 RepID=A0ABT9TYK2_PAEHA|nr:hypothetical protein [Paenibacillus harenae]MDQ0112460.1 hypothetical protein [Paenibacillus harenae]